MFQQTKTERILQKARRAGGGSSIKGITVIRLDKLETVSLEESSNNKPTRLTSVVVVVRG